MPETYSLLTSDGIPSFLIIVTESDCFVCNKHLSDSRTDEHVFPKWLMKKFELSNKKMGLSNGTDIRYKNLRIPCCKECNTKYLSSLENHIKIHIDGGYKKFVTVDESKLFLWASKIFYGLLRKDIVLPVDRTNTKSEGIIAPIMANRYFNLQAWLQTLRHPEFTVGQRMWSLFVFKMRTSTGYDDFDFADHYLSGSIMMRFHDIGIIMCLGDNGSQAHFFKSIYDGIKRKRLHPVQLRELFARISYNLTRLNFFHQGDVTVGMYEDRLKSVCVKPVFKNPEDTVPKYEKEDPKTLSKYLHMYLKVFGFSLEEMFEPPDKCITYVSMPDGDFRVFNKNGDRVFFRAHNPAVWQGNP